MTHSEDRLDRIEQLAANNTIAIASLSEEVAGNTKSIASLSEEMRSLSSNVDRVLARSAILDDVLLELRESHEEHKRNLEEHRREFKENMVVTNNVLQSLNAILTQLTQINPQN